MIITGGENVLPSEVEAVLTTHPLVAQGVVLSFDSQNMANLWQQQLY